MCRRAESSMGGKLPGNLLLPRLSGVFTIAALASLAGCDTQAGNVIYQTANAGSRTVIDLVLTSYANVIAATLAALQGLLTGG